MLAELAPRFDFTAAAAAAIFLIAASIDFQASGSRLVPADDDPLAQSASSSEASLVLEMQTPKTI